MAARYPDNDDDNQHNQRFSDFAGESGQILTPIQGYEKQPLVSLEEAIEPIVLLVPDVKRMAFVAKVKCGTTPANNLSIDQSSSIILYSMDWEPQEECLYYVLNQTLRTANRKKLKPWFLYLRLVLTALSRLPSSSRSVFRGVKCDMRKDYRIGQTVYWWGFSSCTTKMGVLQNEEFLGSSGTRTLFTIECSSGKDIRQHSDFQSEDEILLPPGRQLEVVSCLDQGNGLYLIQLKETEPPYPLLEPISQETHHTADFDLSNSVSSVSSKEQTNIKTNSKMSSEKANPTYSPKQDINILLLGQSGVGKSTFINALVNYMVNDTLETAANDHIQVLIPFSFSFTYDETFDEKTIQMGEADKYEQLGEMGQTCTQKCRSFVFSIGDRLLRLIDTPPVCDSRGCEQDTENFNEIITYIDQYEHLNAICILLKPHEERLTILLRHYINELLRQTPKSAIENIVFVFTNARSTFFMPGATKTLLQRLFDQHQQEHGVQIPFTKENTFLLDNETFRYLAVRHNGIQLDKDETLSRMKSWDHTVKECARLMAYITACQAHTIRNTVSLHEVLQLFRILTTEISELSSLSQINKYISDAQNEKTKVENVYKKLCKFIQINAILPFNEDMSDYISFFIREEKMKRSVGVQNNDIISRLEAIRWTIYGNEIDLLKRTMKNESISTNKTELISADDVFPLVTTLYDLPINGPKIREQVEKLKINQKKIEKREIFVKLPAKAASSILMLRFKDILSKSKS